MARALTRLLAKVGVDGFMLGMVAAVALAWVYPDPGAGGGSLHTELLTKAGVALIFFLHGLSLSFVALRAGAFLWRLHLVVQASTFVLFPLLGLAFLKLAGTWIPADLWLGFFYLCVLPSTVSSSVAMTAAARGNVPAAVFNATLSSLIGVVATPLWLGWMVEVGGKSVPMAGVVVDLLIWLVLPLVVGQLARPMLGAWASRNKPKINLVDRGTILLMVYTSFCDSVNRGVWTGNAWGVVVVAVVGSLILFAAVMATVSAACDALGFSSADKIAAVFCGSKKTLASGVPMAQLIFAGNPGLGLILLPILVYHPLQLMICGVLAGRWAKRADVPEQVSGSRRPEPEAVSRG